MDKVITFLNNLNESGTLMPFLLIAFLIFSMLFVGLFLFLKEVFKILSKKKFGVKIGDREVNYDGSEPGPSSTPPSASESPQYKTERFVSTIMALVNYSIDGGYANCIKRQQLFDSQMRTVNSNIDGIVTNVLAEYLTMGGQNYDIVKILVYSVMEKEIVKKIKDICKADRLAEKTKDKIIEMHRSLIDGAFTHVNLEISRLTQSHTNGNVEPAFQTDLLSKALDSQKEMIRKMIVDALEKAWEDATKYLEEVNENNNALKEKIDNSLKSFFEESVTHDWIMKDKEIPPNRVVGGDQ